MRKLVNNYGGAMIGFLIMLMVVLLVASALVTEVAYQSTEASANADVGEIPGGSALVELWPLLFIIIPIVYIAKKIT